MDCGRREHRGDPRRFAAFDRSGRQCRARRSRRQRAPDRGPSAGAGPLQAAVATGLSNTETASLVVSGASAAPRTPGTIALVAPGAKSPRPSPPGTAGGWSLPEERGRDSPVAVDRVLATQPVPESIAVASVPRSSSFILPPSSLLPPPSPAPHSAAAAVDFAGGQPAGDARPRVAACEPPHSARQATRSCSASLRPARETPRRGPAINIPRRGFFGLDLATLDLLAAAATQRQ